MTDEKFIHDTTTVLKFIQYTVTINIKMAKKKRAYKA